MRPPVLRRDVAIATVLVLALVAGLASAVALHARATDGEDTDQALDTYRTKVRSIFTRLYDDLQPLEDALRLSIGPAADGAPASDVLHSRQVPGAVDKARRDLARLRVPAPARPASAAMSRKLGDVANALNDFPPLDRADPDLVARFRIAQESVETAVYELSVAVRAVIPQRPPRMPGPGESTKHPPHSHAAYLVAAGHICGPAHAKLLALPKDGARQDRVDVLIGGVLDDLHDVPLPEADAPKLKHSVVEPLATDPAVAAEGLAAYGSVSCANLFNDIDWSGTDATLPA